MARRFSRQQILISCEHASNALPSSVGNLGLAAEALASHIAWDSWARDVALSCARALGCVHHEGKYSRLLVDLNRSPHNRSVIPRRSFGVDVPGNRDLGRAERERRLRLYHEPYRTAVSRDLRAIAAEHGSCLHLSIHTFTPKLGGRVRRADAGVLYDPGRRRERDSAVALARAMRSRGWNTRRNYPYRGTSDGLTTYCRRFLPGHIYVGLEIELNQRVLRDAAAAREAADELCAALGQALVKSPADEGDEDCA